MGFSAYIGRSQYRGDLIALSNKSKRAKEVKLAEEKAKNRESKRRYE